MTHSRVNYPSHAVRYTPGTDLSYKWDLAPWWLPENVLIIYEASTVLPFDRAVLDAGKMVFPGENAGTGPQTHQCHAR